MSRRRRPYYRRNTNLRTVQPTVGATGVEVTRYFRVVKDLAANANGDVELVDEWAAGNLTINAAFNRFRQEYRKYRIEKVSCQIMPRPNTQTAALTQTVSPIAFCPLYGNYNGVILNYTDITTMPDCRFINPQSTESKWMTWRRRNYAPWDLMIPTAANPATDLGGFAFWCDTNVAPNTHLASVIYTFKISFTEPKYSN